MKQNIKKNSHKEQILAKSLAKELSLEEAQMVSGGAQCHDCRTRKKYKDDRGNTVYHCDVIYC